MRQKWWTSVLSMALVAILTVLSGCQPVGGLDYSKVIENSFKVKSAESRQTLTFEITPNESAIQSDNERRFLSLFGRVKIDITEAKAKDPLHSSVKGTFEYKGGKIPFHVVVSGFEYTIYIDGVKKPIVLRNTLPTVPGGDDAAAKLSEKLQQQIQEVSKKALDVVPTLGGFFGRNLPNPKTIEVSQVTDSVYGETLSLQKVHAEIKGSELAGLVKAFLTNVLADDQGLKDLIAAVYDIYVPIVKTGLQESGTPEEQFSAVEPYLNNKGLAVEFAHVYVKTILQQFLNEYDDSVQSFLSSEPSGQVKGWLNDNQVVKADVYVDKDNFVRKSNTEFVFNAPVGSTGVVKSLKFTTTLEAWNINKPVDISPIDTSKGVYDINGNEGRATAGKFLAGIDSNSQLYKFLKNELQITKKEIHLSTADDGFNFGPKPYNDNGTVLVPVRFVVESLDSDVEWDGAAKRVKVTDPLNGTVIELTIDSTAVSVNGQAQTLEKPARLLDGSTYVPVAFIARATGAKVEWEQATQTVHITRD